MKTKIYFLLSVVAMFAISSVCNAADYYIKVGGVGDGSSWDSAMSPQDFFSNVETPQLFNDGDTFYFGGGTYYPVSAADGMLKITKVFTMIGGFDPASTGTVSKLPVYPSATPTVFSGDLNGDGKAGEGDARNLLYVQTEKISATTDTVRVQGINFTYAYCNNATNYLAGAVFAKRSLLKIKDCIISDSGSLEYGGAGMMNHGAFIHAVDCEIVRNVTRQLGGGFRSSHNGSWIACTVFERCLIADNRTNLETGLYGGGITISGGNLWLINSTITNNGAFQQGGGISANRGHHIYMMSTTVANNYCTAFSQQAQNLGTQIRHTTEPTFHMFNSTILGSTDTGTIDDSPYYSNLLESSLSNFIESEGYNLTGSFGSDPEGFDDLELVWLMNDNCNDRSNIYNKYFGENTLQNNGGFARILAPVKVLEGAWVEELEDVIRRWNCPVSVDITVDQRGFVRDREEPSYIGAYDPNAKNPNEGGNSLGSITSEVGLKSIGKHLYQLTGAKNTMVKVSDVNGRLIQIINEVDPVIDLSTRPQGFYLIIAGNQAFKIIR